VTPALENMFRAMGQDMPQIKRILELNPSHPLVTGLREAHGADGNGDGLAEMAELIHGMALLAEGGELGDPARFIKLMSDRLQRTL
ncbi:molecular chaperone HtpG, partial [Streptomyces sp. MCAF7]